MPTFVGEIAIGVPAAKFQLVTLFQMINSKTPFDFWNRRDFMMFNAYWEALDFELPLAPATARSGWQRWIDTSLESPEDIMDVAAAPPVPGTQYRVASRSVAALFVRTDDRSGPVIELKPKSS
jgi:pullulanase/glycogen debranching enzyme